MTINELITHLRRVKKEIGVKNNGGETVVEITGLYASATQELEKPEVETRSAWVAQLGKGVPYKVCVIPTDICSG